MENQDSATRRTLRKLALALPGPVLWLISMALPTLAFSCTIDGGEYREESRGYVVAYASVSSLVVPPGQEDREGYPTEWAVNSGAFGMNALVLAGFAFLLGRRYWLAAVLISTGLTVAAAGVFLYAQAEAEGFASTYLPMVEALFTWALPNILMLVGSGAMLFQRYRAAAICGSTALLGAIISGVIWAESDEIELLIGYWVWTGSFVVLLAAGVWGVLKRLRVSFQRRTQATFS